MKNIHKSVSDNEINDCLKDQTGVDVEVKKMITPRSIKLKYTLDIMTKDEQYK